MIELLAVVPGVLLVGSVVTFLAQTAGGADSAPPPWTLVGAIAALASALVYVARMALNNQKDVADKERDRGDRLEALIVQFLPALQEANASQAKNNEALVASTAVLKDALDYQRREK